MSKAIVVVSMMIFIIAGIMMMQSGMFSSMSPLPSEEGQTQLLNAPANQPKVGTLNILFIGNSYTFMHSMPQMIINMAKSDPQNGVELNIQTVTISGATLKNHWADTQAKSLLQIKPWDFIILQDQSDWATQENGVIDNYAYIMRFKGLAREMNEKAIIASFKTWPKQMNSFWYKNSETKQQLRNYNFMRITIDQQTRKNAKKSNTDVVPVGDYWLYITDKNIPIQLYNPDGSHPSVAGSYLNALVFYRYFTMSNLQSVDYLPFGINEQQAHKLREIAALGDLK